jgi:crotonobetainyl-CoA:carnitine CoA-transferase CaiB-like acyl-CoA transferase
MDALQTLATLWRDLGLPAGALDHVSLTGRDPALPSSFHVGGIAQISIAAAALAAAELYRRRTGRIQRVTVDCRNAALEFRSERYCRVNGAEPHEEWDKIAGAYRCGDGGWVRLHTNFPHHRDGVLKLLNCTYERKTVGEALQGWTAEKFEDAAAAAGLVVAKARNFAEWDAHPHGQAVPALPLISIERIGDGPKLELQRGHRSLEGIRIMELTRVLAGPICGRALAAHGSESLRLISPRLPTIETADIDTGRGKRAAHVDLATEQGLADFRALLSGCDVFVQSYRPGALARRGFGPAELAALRPGIVCVSLSAYGHAGPWAERRGFDSLVQTTTGLNFAEAEAAGETNPRPLPCQAIDHASGYLMALGAIAALIRRSEQGGSWLVRVSLARTQWWFRQMGRVADGFACDDPKLEDIGDRIETTASGYGSLAAVRHSAELSETPACWDRPSSPYGTHAARW